MSITAAACMHRSIKCRAYYWHQETIQISPLQCCVMLLISVSEIDVYRYDASSQAGRHSTCWYRTSNDWHVSSSKATKHHNVIFQQLPPASHVFFLCTIAHACAQRPGLPLACTSLARMPRPARTRRSRRLRTAVAATPVLFK